MGGFAEHARRARERWAAAPVGDEPVTLALHTADPGDPVLSDEVRAAIRRQCGEATRFPRDVDPARAATIETVLAYRARLIEAVRVAAEQGWRIEVDDELRCGAVEYIGPNTMRMSAEHAVRLVRPADDER